MDQDAFRKLLSSRPNAAEPSSKQQGRGSLLPSKNKPTAQKNETSTTKPEFKPRKVKKLTDSAYRDRAAERRLGKAGDFAQAEALLEDFQKRHADDEDKDAVEKQRNYLGGDAEHTVLVKGLDFALLEQTKARAAADESGDADELLEAAFRGEASPSPPPPPPPLAHEPASSAATGRKRTREEILRELKSKRTGDGTATKETTSVHVDKPLDEARKDGKFKPIGFKPIGSSASKLKSKDTKEKEGRKKKKRKVKESKAPESVKGEIQGKGSVSGSSNTNAGPSIKTKPPADKNPQEDETPPNDDFDIFAGAGEYEGINLGDDDDESDTGADQPQSMAASNHPSDFKSPSSEVPAEPQQRQGKRWFDDLEPSPPPERPLPSGVTATDTQKDTKGKGIASPPHPAEGGEGEEPSDQQGDAVPEADDHPEEASRSIRLAPLMSSAVPSIRDILAADEVLEAEDKRRARKEKRKAGGGGGGGEGSKQKGEISSEAKLNRDYQRLQAYTKKKGGAS